MLLDYWEKSEKKAVVKETRFTHVYVENVAQQDDKSTPNTHFKRGKKKSSNSTQKSNQEKKRKEETHKV